HFEYTENQEVFVKWQGSSDISDLESKLDTSLLEHLYYLVNKNFPPAIQKSEEKKHRHLGDCILNLKEELSRKSETEKGTMLEMEREKGGVGSEVAKLEELEEQGMKPGQQLQDIFVEKGKKPWVQ
ncbi:MAG: hypothetical protein KAQ73_08580, partial [Dehalococcoidia bacterium]|nr:hypothetical protein [Dehalococcoidia bacterium]